MKSLYVFLFIVIAVSCSKQARINRKLDGSWTLVSIDGTVLPANNISYRQYVFARTGNKTGTVNIQTETVTNGNYHFHGTYTINNKGQLNMDLEDMYSNPVELNYEVTSFSNKEIVMVDAGGGVNVLEGE